MHAIQFFLGAAVAAALCGAIPVPASAQWLNYPTPGMPRLPNGKPNLAAPAPRTANGRPDLSGVWELEPAHCDPRSGIGTCGQDYVGGPEFGNIGARLGSPLPYQPWAAALVKQRAAGQGKDDPVALCQPAGALRLLTYPPYRKILQTPGATVILSERDVTFRQIFTDGRPLPEDPNPSWNGYSVGKWDGDTLVVQTIGFHDGTWLDRKGSPLTEAGKMTERFHRVNFGNLEIEVTIDDPKAYTRPWTVKLHQMLVPDTDLLEYYCQENEKDNRHIRGK
ncbi:MAG TPA: hypothetical protein VJ732_17405 [Bryobacteraceae bacterium]|nr:hypothetical protein [Bryobacteraceae bacterium]